MRSLFLTLALLAAPAFADIAPPEPVPAPTPAPAPAAAAQHPEGIEKAYSGVIQGGWEYVYASYGLGTAGVLAYAASLFVRRPRKSAA
jgi:hypothetical protein